MRNILSIITLGLVTIVGLAASTPTQAAQSRNRGRPVTGSHALQFRLGGFFPAGGGTVWDDNQAFFSLNIADFNDAMVGITYIGAANRWVEFGINADFYDASSFSAERGVVDSFGFPVAHDTRLTLLPLTADVRFLIGGKRARRQARPLVYLGGGVGVTFWEYEEVGEFVDFSSPDLKIFAGNFNENGLALETHVLAGIALPVQRNLSVILESRYSWADDQLDSNDFPGFGRLNLGGPSVFVGASFRF